MKKDLFIGTLAATALLALSANYAAAQGQGGGGGGARQPGAGAGAQQRPGNTTRGAGDQDRDRARDMDRDREYSGDRDMDRDRRRDQDRDRIYSSDLMTQEERVQHWNQLRSLKTEQERIQYRLDHQKAMQQRAKEKGVSAPPGLSRSRIAQQESDRQQERQRIYGYDLMTQTELEQHRERLRVAKTQQERDTIRAEHHTQMEARAREQGITLARHVMAGRTDIRRTSNAGERDVRPSMWRARSMFVGYMIAFGGMPVIG
ncbi:MAG: hypothetical protein IPG49_04345 [Proteobacteria bacterium]|nr:hypothetical protein [Pseudomonadota bacterium]